jgi:hypothetical protein
MVATAASVAAKLPWKQIIASLPTVVSTAQRLWQDWRATPTPKPIDTSASLETQILGLSKRVEALELNERTQAEVVSQLAEQLQGVAAGLKEQSTRVGRLVIAVSVLAVALVALGVIAVMFVARN